MIFMSMLTNSFSVTSSAYKSPFLFLVKVKIDSHTFTTKLAKIDHKIIIKREFTGTPVPHP